MGLSVVVGVIHPLWWHALGGCHLATALFLGSCQLMGCCSHFLLAVHGVIHLAGQRGFLHPHVEPTCFITIDRGWERHQVVLRARCEPVGYGLWGRPQGVQGYVLNANLAGAGASDMLQTAVGHFR